VPLVTPFKQPGLPGFFFDLAPGIRRPFGHASACFRHRERQCSLRRIICASQEIRSVRGMASPSYAPAVLGAGVLPAHFFTHGIMRAGAI
jgi:hypothetical protein